MSLLHDSPLLRLMVATWPGVWKRVSDVPEDERPAAITRAWMEATGAPRRKVKEGKRVLFTNEICRADGTADPLAVSYVAQVGISLLPRAKKEAKS